MRIEADARIIEMHLKHPFRIATGERRTQPSAFLRLRCRTLTGWGEAPLAGFDPGGPEALLADIRRAQDVLDAAAPDPAEPLDALLPRITAGLPASTPLRCALETALADLHAQTRAVPLHAALGLEPGPIPLSSFTLGIADPDLTRRKLDEARGLPILKIKLGAARDAEILRLVRADTDAALRVDANGGWTERTARELVPLCADLGVEFIEQPFPMGEIDASARLADHSPLPIVLDEDCRTPADARRLAGRVHGVNVKLRKAGGVWSALQTLQEARRLGLRTMIGCFIESSVGITAAAHLASLADWLDLDGAVLVRDDPFEGARWDRGRITLPEGPGLGVRTALQDPPPRRNP
jgi:L-alanine-DL-glutamate epimerase-like enolase superfamily enzyme